MVRLAYYLLSRRFLKKNIISVVLQKATVSNTYLWQHLFVAMLESRMV